MVITLWNFAANIKVMAEKSRIAGWQTVTNTYWTDVAKRIQNEKPTTKNI
jgi:hypothetical protein